MAAKSTSTTASSKAASSTKRTSTASPAKKSTRATKKVKKETEGDSEYEEDWVPKGETAGHGGGDGLNVLPEQMAKTPLAVLYNSMKSAAELKVPKADSSGVVVYWMRNKDLRVKDNRALAHATSVAKNLGLPLVVLHIFSPGDYVAHDRAARRIDFHVRQLHYLQPVLAKANIPLHTITWQDRKQIPRQLIELLGEWKAFGVYANLEYEVDELGRDKEIVDLVIQARQSGKGWAGEAMFMKDFCIVSPGEVLTKQGKPYSVYSPWYRNWGSIVAADPLTYLDDAGTFEPNPDSAKTHPILKPLFEHQIPKEISGFSLDKENQENMNKIWPVGENIPDQVLQRFLKTKIRQNMFQNPPLEPGAEEVDKPATKSKIGEYATGRNRVDLDGTSHISPYLAAGLISSRECLRQSMKLSGKLQVEREGGIGVWVSEIAWRDFYQHVLAAWPRVCRGRPFNLKFENVVWEYDDEKLKAWKDGKTGSPIVDAGMRALKVQGYMHNRLRMIVAMFLTKDLLLDWHEGEKYFSQQLIDSDFGANNGGWQWSASTGCDPQPYFRVFNPVAQSEKADPSGDYIRYWVPELKSVKGKAIHDPHSHLGKKEIEKLGYVVNPIVPNHSKARIRAIARYKNPGQNVDE